MVVQHNIMALNAYNRLSNNNSMVSKNLEKLSSGYRINRAGDDAAGLAISEKMRAQITGLERASDNAQDGISLVQTAEGALTEVHSMLNRMTELATQSANGTFDNEVDRANLQKEVDSLKSEINRIAESTNFNGINLLDGSLGAAAGVSVTEGVGNSFTLADGVKVSGIDLSGTTGLNSGEAVKMTIAADTGTKASNQFTYRGVTFKLEATSVGTAGNGKTIAINSGSSNGVSATGSDITVTLDKGTASNWNTAANFASAVNAQLGASNLSISVVEGDWAPSSAPAGDGNEVAKTSATAGGAAAVAGQKNVTVTVGTGDTAKTFTAAGTFANGDEIALTNADNGSITMKLLDTTDVADAELGSIGGDDMTAGSTTLDFTGKVGADVIGSSVEVNGKNYEFVKTGEKVSKDGNIAVTVDDAATAKDIATALKNAITADNLEDAAGKAVATVAQGTEADGTTLNGKVILTSVTKDSVDVVQTGKGLGLQIGDTADQKISVKVDNMNSTTLGLDNVNISSESQATGSIKHIKAAINTVSSTRADLGAIQNRLEHTVNNLATTTENLTSAESRIRDTDMASEMMSYTKNNVLSQAAQAMLAQANQQPQQILQLLQ